MCYLKTAEQAAQRLLAAKTGKSSDECLEDAGETYSE
ncbi:hypothetical protein SAMN06298226_2454 [Nitrosovibrio sp. Nv4]|nr:hypothetical protein SAMN06298226_2454 [Nitrosovibrio sp. Nv4]